MNMQNTSEAQSRNEQQITLGDKFRLAREALNLTPEQVSKEISLRPALVRLIENNQFTNETIPATFMRGYVRSYAKFLRIPDSDWVNAIHFGNEQKNDLGKNARATRSVNQYSSHNNWIGYLSALVILIVVGMTGIWWWESHQQSNAERDVLVNSYTPSAAVTTEVNTAPAKPAGNEIPVLQPTAKIENTLTDNAPKGTRIEIQTKPLTEKPAVTNTAPVVQASSTAATANVLQSEIEKIGGNEQLANVQPDAQAATEPQSAVENPSVSAAATNDNLHIEVIGNCWISVKDKNRKVLAQKEYKQGDVLSFNEEEPYSLIIGAPGNVRITYKGQAFPLTVDGRVAKFKLPQ
ncbi:RodZ domain-containing protein [Aggregatibacter actinomycetemcomitans]|uniref:RodZ domain-containing protein n=1 Tax=Aggregatibacter actinomycetemcomitans TaxID=714 RepID=UPI00197C97F4|nr:RodZ family helix-turn-helix domain-containing protein [Aggregatibacter actinomycetemcomitans]MBN6064727.1 helix-turn-helix domain-containing protein [Aggregatibacter actinomycetemcomitans]MBN6081863.1 helix-turn-helix domain-containing protein [Aggregatibacter actinomycetemcomitans]MBN6084153.1 helix-turn-helix domain-containing protein [Aggregatibacter actinomycetemcomitans]